MQQDSPGGYIASCEVMSLLALVVLYEAEASGILFGDVEEEGLGTTLPRA